MQEMEYKMNNSWSARINWVCEKWSEEAVEFARRQLEREGKTYIVSGISEVVQTNRGLRSKLASIVLGEPIVSTIKVPKFIPITGGITSFELRRIVGEAEMSSEVNGNLLLNEGIQRLEDLLIAAGGTSYNNANAYIGVGDSTTAEAATQTDLQASSNKFYKGMNATFPSRSSQTVTWQSDFTTSEANYVWNEWTIAAGATSASGSGFTVGTTNLNRKVASLGTKVSGTWTLSGTVVIS